MQREFKISLSQEFYSDIVYLSQYDSDYPVIFTVTDKYSKASGINGYTAKFTGTRGDGTGLGFTYTATAIGHTVSFTIDTMLTGVAGTHTGEIIFYDQNDLCFGTANVQIIVEPAARPDGTIDADEEELRDLAQQCQDIVDTAAAEVKGEAESWAVGERDGEPVPSTDPAYHNNAKYYAEQAQEIADSIGIDATLSVSGKAADAKKTGDALDALKEDLNDVSDALSYEVTEDIYNTLTFTLGYMSKAGVIGSASTLQYSNKIPVNAGNTLYFTASNVANFRFVTAFFGESAVENSGAENVKSYIVPDGITDVVVTIYTPAQNAKIELTHNTLIDVDGLKDDVDGLKEDVEHALSYTFGYFNSTALQYWNQTAQRIVYFKCKSGVSYKVRKTLSSERFDIAYIKNEPSTGVQQPVYGYVANSGTTTEANFTTGEDALYLLVLLGRNENDDAVAASITITSNEIQLRDDVARTVVTFDEAYLPAHIYLVTGKDYEIYHDQICPKAENYTFKWNAGNNYGNRVRLNYNTTGEKSLRCEIYNADGTLAKQLTTTVHVVNITSDNIYLLPFGDSLTNHCVWESELMNMTENIVCVGSRSRNVKDSDGETRTVYDEGRAGFTSFNYTNGSQYVGGTDNGGDESPHNRWYDPINEKFSAEYYFENNFPSDQTDPNMMTIYLGMNDLLGTHAVDEIVDNIQDIIDDILSYDNNMKIVLISPQLRYIPSLTGHEHLLFLDYARKMETMSHNYENIVFLPLPVGMDSKNNYNMTTVSINTRSSLTEQTASDVTHPAYAGYWQIADYVLGAISYIASNN